jgi:hypothetical protein
LTVFDGRLVFQLLLAASARFALRAAELVGCAFLLAKPPASE